MIRVLIVDDDPLVRSGLALILGGAPSIEVVGQAGDGVEALAAVDQHRPDVVLMDIRMPRLDGIEATARLAEPRTGAGAGAGAGARVIVLTTFGADDYVVRALRAGASGFLLKDTPPAEIVAAVERVHAGEPMLSPSVTATLIDRVTGAGADAGSDVGRRRAARARLDRLTDRELEVARAVGRGLSNAEIAAELYLSVPTVKAHIGRLFTKLEAENRVQVALCLHDAGEDPARG